MFGRVQNFLNQHQALFVGLGSDLVGLFTIVLSLLLQVNQFTFTCEAERKNRFNLFYNRSCTLNFGEKCRRDLEQFRFVKKG